MDESSLNKFFVATQNLRDAMEDDIQLDATAQLRLENYMALLHMTYSEWKRRNVPPNPVYWPASYSDRQDESMSSTAN